MTGIFKKFFLTILFAAFASQASALFIQADWLDPTAPGVGTNRYAYSFNDPVNLSDPTGNEVGAEDHEDPTELARNLQRDDPGLFGELSNNYDLSELPLDDPRVQAIIESYTAYATSCGGPCPEIQRQIGAAAGVPGIAASEQAQTSVFAGALAAGMRSRILGPRPHPNAIPHASNAVIDPNKLTGYALNPAHPVGGNKARVFESALGITSANAGSLSQQILSGVRTQAARPGRTDQYGTRYSVDVPVVGPTGSGTVTTGWIVRPNSTTPSMTTVWVK